MPASPRQRGLKKTVDGGTQTAAGGFGASASTIPDNFARLFGGSAVRRLRSAVSRRVTLMDDTPYIPPTGPNSAPVPSREIYASMGEANIFRMLADFYAELGHSPIRAMFPEDLRASSEKSAAFFVGLLGGPPLYQQRYGAPMMRARHLPFPIDEAARQAWLDCWEPVLTRATSDYNFPSVHLEGFRAFLVGFSGWMVNRRSLE